MANGSELQSAERKDAAFQVLLGLDFEARREQLAKNLRLIIVVLIFAVREQDLNHFVLSPDELDDDGGTEDC